MEGIETPKLIGLLAAVGGGLLVGIERERRKGDGAGREPAGVRTFTVIALMGAVAALIGQPAIWIAGAGTAGFALASYLRADAKDPGLTTEFAMLATFLLAVLALESSTIAAALFVLLAM